MLFFVIGMPGAFADWCDAVVARLACRSLGPTGIIAADTLEQVGANILPITVSRAVISSRRPGGGLCAALAEADDRFITVREDARIALAELVCGGGAGALADAVQAVASSAAALAGCRTAPGALILDAARDRADPAATIAAIAGHLGLAVDPAAIGEMIAELAAPDAADRAACAAWWDNLDPSSRQMAEGALAPYLGTAHDGGSACQIVWEAPLFFRGERPGERVSGPVDITGRARCLVHGPEIAIEPGCWSLALTARFSREAAEYSFLIEVLAGVPLASATLRPQEEDLVSVRLDFAVDPLAEHPVSLRVSTVRAAFDGAFTLVAATLVRGDPAPEESEAGGAG